MSLLRKINKEVQDFKTKQIQIVPGLTFNQYDILNRVFYYYNSKYTSKGTEMDPIDDDGNRLYFLNINKNPCKICSKAIDFDTKNFRALTVGGGDPLKTWFVERDLKYWMRENDFGKTLNQIFHDLPIYGTVVLKIVEGKVYFVDLRNFVVEQSADSLNSMNYINEIHNFTVTDFKDAAKTMKWDDAKVEETIEQFYRMKDTSHIRVYERYGVVPEETTDGKMTYEYKRVFHADVGVDEYDQRERITVPHGGVCLSSEKWEGNPYVEIHMEKMPGRWLGIGVVETLFEPQIRQNELANLQSKSSYWAALRVFQTRDPAGGNRNLASDASNGEVLYVDSEITQIDMSDRNLAFFNQDDLRWMRNRDELTFSYDVVQGERLPAGTPLGSAQIAVSQTLSYFEQIQENIALDIKKMVYEKLLPYFEKRTNKEHTIRLVGKDLDAYVEMVKNDLALKEMIRLAIGSLQGKPFPTNHDRDIAIVAVGESIKQGKEAILTVPEGFYKDAKYDIDIDITGESMDTRVRYATKFAILQAITADPSMTTDPIKRAFLFSMAEDGGVNLVDLLGAEKKDPEQLVPEMQGRAGGGVSAPAMGAAVPGQSMQTV